METTIVDLEKVLLPRFLTGGKKIKKYETKRLTAPGENYGSLMLAVDITVQDPKTNVEDKIDAVAKMVPDNEFIRKMFQSPITFKKELELYRTIVPTLQQFQREHGLTEVIDCFPEFYGGRMSLNDEEDFDFHAMILLENLKTKGYKTVERTQGFNLQTSKLILRDLAKFHAVPMALKHQKPELFNEKIRPYINHLLPPSGFGGDSQNSAIIANLDIAKEDLECAKHLEGIKRAMERAKDVFTEYVPPNELWGTMAHCDFWVNNTLVKFDNTGKAINNKIVDFQITHYASVAKDLSFFLFLSVQNHFIINNYQELVDEYYKTFIATLKELNVDTTLFTMESLEKEIETTVKNNTLMHCIFMLKPVFAPMTDVKNVEDLSMDDLQHNSNASQLHKEKLWFIIKEMLKRNWIE